MSLFDTLFLHCFRTVKNVDTQNLFVKCVTELISFQLIKRNHFIDVSFLKHNMNQDGVNRTVFDYMVWFDYMFVLL